MSRDTNMTELRRLLRKHAARCLDDLDENKLMAVIDRLDHMIALIEACSSVDRTAGVSRNKRYQ